MVRSCGSSDVARIELGSESYSNQASFNTHPATGMAVRLAPGADALRTSELVRAEVERQSRKLSPTATATRFRRTAPTS